jgi:hypothetical protein
VLIKVAPLARRQRPGSALGPPGRTPGRSAKARWSRRLIQPLLRFSAVSAFLAPDCPARGHRLKDGPPGLSLRDGCATLDTAPNSQGIGATGALRRRAAQTAASDLDSTPRLRDGRSAGISDGNRDGNDCSRQRPDAAVDSRVLSHIPPELGIRYT